MQQTPAFEQALQAARTFSIAQNINYISSHLICCAVIEQIPEEDAFLDSNDKAILLQKLFAVIVAQPGMAAPSNGEIPFTHEARTILVLALHYQHAFEDEAADLCHYVLAILSCNTRATELLKERGWVFRNYLDWLTQKRGISIDFPDQLYPANDYIPRRHKLSFLKGLFNPKAKQAIAQQYIEDSLQLLEYKDIDRAVYAMDLAKDAVRDANYYSIRTGIEMKAKRYTQALKTIEEALQKGIAAENLFLDQAGCLYHCGDYDRCIEVCKAQLPTTVHAAEAHNMIGLALARKDFHQEAIAHYDQALQLYPEYAFALSNKGFSLFQLGLADDAIAIIHASLQIYKGNSMAYRNLAIIANRAGEPQLAGILREKAFLFGYREDYGNDLDKLQIASAGVLAAQ